MTKLREIFEKPIDRHIDGVIKADDVSALLTEIDEYVLTNEIAKSMEQFLGAYNDYQGANGVWISGFFGSGKSHLLKILSYLVENKLVEGVPVFDLFVDKIDKFDNVMLKGELNKASSVPSKSILFNIDQKADIISKSSEDALLSVFVKVFDESCGYYGKQGYIAQFERQLDERGLLGSFKTKYNELSGKSWERGREEALLEAPNISKAYTEVSGTDIKDAQGILDKYRKDYKVSIEDFAEKVKSFIDKQGAHFRLNFFVDEVGQYIAENVKLMTNLQTIAESLATKCKGRAWIIVTAQEDMNTVVGELGKRQSSDFSKIQARFQTRMKLTSADVAEVIQKRLLAKKTSYKPLLSDIYNREKNNFKTLLGFVDGAQNYKNFKDEQHFIYSYPFLPYQFGLFQTAIQNLSEHNAFEGRHSSVGERSMLGVFQEVAKRISEHEMGELATFDLMFEGIRSSLKTQIQSSITKAEKELDDKFAISLLKALFLVKYVREFKASIRNLSVLMLGSFTEDIKKQQEKIAHSLELLEREIYIQRTGEFYEYLTNDEKDIEQEIKETEIEEIEFSNLLSDEIFGTILGDNSIKLDDNGQSYSFAKKIDDRLTGRDQELTINIISPLSDFSTAPDIVASHSLGKPELSIILPQDARLIRDIKLYKQTEKYIRQNMRIAENETKKTILTSKGNTNNERLVNIRLRLKELVSKSVILSSGNRLDINIEDPKSLIKQAFNELIKRVYPSLGMIGTTQYTENKMRELLLQSTNVLIDSELVLSEAEKEVMATIQMNKHQGIRSTLKTIIEVFEKKPYGWYLNAVLCTVAKLANKGKIEVRSDSNLIEKEQLADNLLNNRLYANLILSPQIDFSSSQIRAVKDFYQDMFDDQLSSTEAKDVGNAINEQLKDLQVECKHFLEMTEVYPFLKSLQPLQQQLLTITNKPYNFYISNLSEYEEELLKLKEDVFTPIQHFMSGTQKDIFDSARHLLFSESDNLDQVDSASTAALLEVLEDTTCFRGSKVQQLKPLIDKIYDDIEKMINLEKVKSITSVNLTLEKVINTPDYKKLDVEKQSIVQSTFISLKEKIDRSNMLSGIQVAGSDALHNAYVETINDITSWTTPVPVIEAPSGKESDVPKPKPIIPRPSISGRDIRAIYAKATLETEDDVNEYLDNLRQAYLKEIKNNKRIII